MMPSTPTRREVEEMKGLYRQGGIGDVQVKKELVAALNTFLDPIRERRAGGRPATWAALTRC